MFKPPYRYQADIANRFIQLHCFSMNTGILRSRPTANGYNTRLAFGPDSQSGEKSLRQHGRTARRLTHTDKPGRQHYLASAVIRENAAKADRRPPRSPCAIVAKWTPERSSRLQTIGGHKPPRQLPALPASRRPTPHDANTSGGS